MVTRWAKTARLAGSRRLMSWRYWRHDRPARCLSPNGGKTTGVLVAWSGWKFPPIGFPKLARKVAQFAVFAEFMGAARHGQERPLAPSP